MLKHIVCWKIQGNEAASKESNLAKMKELLDELPNLINEIEAFEVGINFNESEAAYDISLFSVFADNEALDIYQKHPEHLRVAEFIKKVTLNRVVVDYFD